MAAFGALKDDMACLLAVRASWTHVGRQLEKEEQLDAAVRTAVEKVVGESDDVVADMILRHVRCFLRRRLAQPTCSPPPHSGAQVQRCVPKQDLLVHEITQLVALLIGIQRAGMVLRTVLDYLEEGIEISWYDKQLRQKYSRTKQVAAPRPRAS